MRGTRGWGTWIAVLAVLVAVLAAAVPASAETLPVPPGFQLKASNGYLLSVLGLRNPDTGQSAVLVSLGSRRSSVIYSTRAAQVTETSIEADLGVLGRIDVEFVPSGEARPERSDCGGKPIPFDSGHYAGPIVFEGEGGFSKAHATSAVGYGKLLLNLVCSESRATEGIGGHSPGARLTAHGKGREGVEFSAFKNSPTRPARFNASIGEKRGRMEISRSVAVAAPPSAFAFVIPPGLATVEPPAPFDGRAEYRRLPGGGSSWRGDLSVDFPGRPDVPLIGTHTRVSLERAVLNPSHPFRAF